MSRQAIEAIVAKFVEAGAINDKEFAQTKARSLHRRGTSSRLTRQKLKMAGVDGDTLDEAMQGLDVELDVTPAQRELRAAAAPAARPLSAGRGPQGSSPARPRHHGPRRLRLRRCQKGDRRQGSRFSG